MKSQCGELNSGNSIKEYKSMSDTIQSLDEKDLGLMEDMDKIIWGDK